MSWFNPKAFAAGALKELENIVDTNIEEAKTYEEEQRELFKTNKKTIEQRRRLVDAYETVANELRELGASNAQIRAAHSSGLGNLSKLLKDVKSAIKARSGTGTKLSKFDVEAMITSGGVVPQVDDQYDDMDLREFIAKSMNLGEGGTLEVDPQRNILQKALGYRSKDAVRAKLDREMGTSTMSILDINEAASRSAFESLMPGAYASVSDGAVYDRAKAYTLFDRVQKNKMREVTESPAYQEARGKQQFDEMDRLKYEAMKPFAIQQWTLHGKEAAEDDVINYKSTNVLGPDLYNELYLQMFGETDGLEDSINDLTSNKVTLANGVEVITDINGNVSKIILPENDNSPTVTVTDRDGIIRTLANLESLNLLPTDSDTFDEDLTGPVDTDDDAEEEARLAAEVEAKRKAEEEARLAGEADGGADALKAEKLMDDIDSIVKEYPFYQETVEEFLGPDVDLTSTAALRKLANSLSSSISDSGKGNRSARLRLLNAVKELRNLDSGTEDSGAFNALDFAKKYLLGKNFGGDT